jgi:hypothetical protein
LIAEQRALQAVFVKGKTASKRFVFLVFRKCSIAMSSPVQLEVGRAGSEILAIPLILSEQLLEEGLVQDKGRSSCRG